MSWLKNCRRRIRQTKTLAVNLANAQTPLLRLVVNLLDNKLHNIMTCQDVVDLLYTFDLLWVSGTVYCTACFTADVAA